MKTALVTGSSRGLGKAIADALAHQGYLVIRNGREKRDDEHFITCDVTDHDQCKEMATIVEKDYQNIDLLVCNAGITRDKTVAKMSLNQWKDVINTNLTGVFNTINTLLPLMSKNASIIVIGSKAAEGNFGQANYAAAKAGLRGLVATLKLELKEQSIHLIEPGLIGTEMVKAIPEHILPKLIERFGPVQEPEEIVKQLLDLI